MDLLNNLNKEQLAAVTHANGPLLIIAGAGTGKTTIISQRIAHLIEKGLAKPDEILALTFTDKAANEMEERVDCLLPVGYLDLWISTFHGFGEKILKEHGLEIGLPGGFKLLNEFEQWALIRKNLDKFNLDYYRPLGNPTKFIHALIRHFSRAKDEDISPEEYINYADELVQNKDNMLAGNKKKISNDKFQISNKNPKSKIQNLKSPSCESDINSEIEEQEAKRIYEVANAYHVYQQLLLDNNALDFGDLINYTLKLFRERPAILEKYRRQFKYIQLDEFQDTNWSQYELVKMLSAPENNLVVVGDDDQAIYRFRGASMSNILQFKNDFPQASEVVLVNNYRNTQNILDLSYDFIQLNNPNRLEWQLNQVEIEKLKVKSNLKEKNALSKKLISGKKESGCIEVIKGEDLADEIRQVAEKIADLKIKDKDATWNDFAVLVRANDSAKDFCHFFDIAGLPYIFLSSRGLYAKPVIMDVVAYLKLLDNYHESAALFRVLNMPVFNFSYQELINFNYWARKKSWSLYEVLKSSGILSLGPDIRSKVDKVLKLIAGHTALVRGKAVSEIIMAFITDSGYLQYLTRADERTSRENIGYLNQFLKRTREFESSSDDKSVKAFLAELDLEIDAGEQGGLAPDLESGPEAIKVMTVHAAKGLEYKYVFIANLVDKRFPTIERKEAIAIPDALVKEILPAGDVHLEEERRLLYVAMTRAKEGLFFSWSPDYGGTRKKKPSVFLLETGLVKDGKKADQAGPTAAKSGVRDQTEDQKAKIDNDQSKSAGNSHKFAMPKYFSYTQLAAFNNCPYQYRFAHILKIPVRGKFNFSFGKTMHGTLQKLFGLINEKKGLGQANLFNKTPDSRDDQPEMVKESYSPDIGFDEIAKLYEASWIDDWYDSKEQKEKYRKLGLEILKVFHAKYNRAWPNAIFLEKGFNIKITVGGELYTIRGAIDRIDEIEGKIKIIDYKTGRPKDKLTADEKDQLFIYQLAVSDLFEKAVGGLAFYYLENNSEVEFLGKPEDLDKIKTKIINTINEIKKSEFPAKPSQLCPFCDFFDICEFRKS